MFIDQDLQDVTALNLGELDLSSQDEHVLDELDGKFLLCCLVEPDFYERVKRDLYCTVNQFPSF